MTIHQPPAGTKTDYGTIGFEKNVSGQVLIFPKSLSSFADKRVIGVKYDLLEWASVPKSQQAPKAQLAKPATKSKPKKIHAQRVEQPVAEESAPARVLKFPAVKVEPPEPEPTPPPLEPEPTPPPLDQPPEFEIPEPTPAPAPTPVSTPIPHPTPKNEERMNEEVEEIKKQVRQATKILEEGKQVAAFTEIMSFDEIVEEVPKLTGEERDALRSYLDQYEAMENDAIDEGLRSLKEEPTITFEELDRRISEKFGWK